MILISFAKIFNMNILLKHIFTLSLVVLFFQCKEKVSDNPKPEMTQSGTETKNELPPISDSDYNYLMKECDFIDYIFFDLPFSLSQDEKESIIQNMNFISREGVSNIPAGCKPMARKFFKVKGTIVWEAEVYMSDQCKHFIFYKDNKAVYANKMAQSGINFYNNLIDQAAKIGQQQGQGQ
jgi:hypothetical protein